MNHLAYVLANDKEVLRYLKSRFPVFHLSNVFFRDIHYGIMEYLREHKMTVRYQDGEKIARAFIEKLEYQKILRPLDRLTWMVQYADFRTPPAKTAAPVAGAKPPASVAGPTGPAATNNIQAPGAAGVSHAPVVAASTAGPNVPASTSAGKAPGVVAAGAAAGMDVSSPAPAREG
jgi:hypothetical protein